MPSFDSTGFGDCIDCIRGKLFKTDRKGSTHSKEILEIIHTDIYGILKPILCENKYFITFIDVFLALDMSNWLIISQYFWKNLKFLRLK